ncbi:Amn1 protein [Saccharomycopsis crataegensis]|uniref:Amn1 protein n=1 Tax=Saccharomycopsis crataegensis TaxID=43959 RepID=A0AAV5QPG1_9ASCO|nr:Amn1 protein [Saccharomycopsis crataegensis]
MGSNGHRQSVAPSFNPPPLPHQHRVPSHQLSITNLKRSLSKSSSISSLKSILRLHGNKNGEEDTVEESKTTKRKKIQLFNEHSFKRKKLLRLFSSERFHRESSTPEQQKSQKQEVNDSSTTTQHISNNQSLSSSELTPKSKPSQIPVPINPSSSITQSQRLRKQQRNPHSRKSRKKYTLSTAQPSNIETEKLNIKNLDALDKKVFSFSTEQHQKEVSSRSSSGNYKFDMISEEPGPKTLITNAKTTLSFASKKHLRQHQQQLQKIPERTNPHIVTSAAHYNLAKFINSDPQTPSRGNDNTNNKDDDIIISSDDEEAILANSTSTSPNTITDISINENTMASSTTAMSSPSTHIITTYYDDEDEEEADNQSTSAVSNGKKENFQNDDANSSSGFLNYFNDNIERFHEVLNNGGSENSKKKKDIIESFCLSQKVHNIADVEEPRNHQLKNQQSASNNRQNGKDITVNQLAHHLSMTNLGDNNFSDAVQRKKSTQLMNSGKGNPRVSVLDIPEIVENILFFVEASIIMPLQDSSAHRKPLSIDHAKSIYKNDPMAREAWKELKSTRNPKRLNEIVLASYLKHDANGKHCRSAANNLYSSTTPQSVNNFRNIKIINGTIYNCLFVNKLWYSIARKLIFKRIFFSNDQKFQKLITGLRTNVPASMENGLLRPNEEFETLRDQLKSSFSNVLLLHKMKHVTQDQINLLASYIVNNGGNKLQWIEFYICPNIVPPLSLFTSHHDPAQRSRLKKLVLAGCNSKKINNFFLKIVATNCENLVKIDLRSCEHFTDDGLMEFSNYCQKLEYLNVGRFKNCEQITDISISSIIRHCDKLTTLGCAGCFITDSSMFTLASSRSGQSIEKLSLNNCLKLTDASIPTLLDEGQFPRLAVLEVRNVVNFTSFVPIVTRYQQRLAQGKGFLVENCEVLEKKMLECEFSLNLAKSRQILKDIEEWCNTAEDDGDVTFQEFVKIKRRELEIMDDEMMDID